MKIVINKCYGGFSLSEAAYKELGKKWDGFGYDFNKERTNPELVSCVEKLGKKANGRCASLAVVEVPDEVDWELDEYDGMETVREKSRSWS